MSDPIRIFLIDDHIVVRDSIAALLDSEPGFEVIGAARGIEEGLRQIRALRPDVAMVDIALPDGDGVRILEELGADGVPVRCVVFTGQESLPTLSRVLAAGACGYVSKAAEPEQVLTAIRDAAEGRRPIVASFASTHAPGPGPDELLSEREAEVLSLLAYGHSSKEMAELLDLSPATVDTYRHRIMKKLGLRHRWELVRYALDHGLLR